MAFVPADIDVELLVKDFPADQERVREISVIRREMFDKNSNLYEGEESLMLYREFRRILNKYRHHRYDLTKELKKVYYDVWDF